jgi:hypothetical protein
MENLKMFIDDKKNPIWRTDDKSIKKNVWCDVNMLKCCEKCYYKDNVNWIIAKDIFISVLQNWERCKEINLYN